MGLFDLFGKKSKGGNVETNGVSESIKKVQKVDGIQNVYNLIIVDESGSMGHLRDVTLSGINEVIGTIRSAQEEFGDVQKHYLTLVTFDSSSGRQDVRTVIDLEPIDKVGEFKDYRPNGCTPLYDAMGQSLSRLKQTVGDDIKASVAVTVLTDGMENSSKEWRPSALRKLIEELKEQGWSFSYMGSAHNVKSVTDLLSIDNVMEFSHDVKGARNTWARESSSRKSFFAKSKASFMLFEDMTGDEIFLEKCRNAKSYYEDRVTPENIECLAENEVLVFFTEGVHYEGMAARAVDEFGAVRGQKEGLQGKCFAIPKPKMLEMMIAIDELCEYAQQNPDLRFLVTRMGIEASVEAHVFEQCIRIENISLPEEYWEEYGLNMY